MSEYCYVKSLQHQQMTGFSANAYLSQHLIRALATYYFCGVSPCADNTHTDFSPLPYSCGLVGGHKLTVLCRIELEVLWDKMI